MYRWSLLAALFGCLALSAGLSESDEDLISELNQDDQDLARTLISNLNLLDDSSETSDFWGTTDSDEKMIAELNEEEQYLARSLIAAVNLYDDSEDAGFERNIKDRVTADCDCQGTNNCGCCTRIQIVGSSRLKLCGNVSVVPSEYAFQVGMRVGKMYSFKTKISAKKLERVCDRLPLFLKSVKLCLKSSMEQLSDENSFKSCMLIDVEIASKVITTFKFKCLRYENGVLSFEGRSEEETGAIANIKTPNPIKTVIDLVKKEDKNKGSENETS